MNIENFKKADVAGIAEIYKDAFSGYPWFEDLSFEVIHNRLKECFSFPGFNCLIVKEDNQVVGTIWWDVITLERLENERGSALVGFVKEKFSPKWKIIWERDVIVKPTFQCQGIATELRREFIKIIRFNMAPCVILSRMRSDNFGIMKIAEKLGFSETGIMLASSQKKGVFHKYWFLTVDAR